MISTFAKLSGPIAGLGKAGIRFSKAFNKLTPERRMILTQQWLKQLRAEYDRAESENRIVIKAEDARNASEIRLRA